jgi:hypothetical protein
MAPIDEAIAFLRSPNVSSISDIARNSKSIGAPSASDIMEREAPGARLQKENNYSPRSKN